MDTQQVDRIVLLPHICDSIPSGPCNTSKEGGRQVYYLGFVEATLPVCVLCAL